MVFEEEKKIALKMLRKTVRFANLSAEGMKRTGWFPSN
jgi:hypothetical protein